MDSAIYGPASRIRRSKSSEYRETPPNLTKKFREKFDPLSLLMDEDHSLAKAFGVWGLEKFMGREFDGIHRMSFLVDEEGKIEKAYHKVKAKEHPDQVLERSLKSSCNSRTSTTASGRKETTQAVRAASTIPENALEVSDAPPINPPSTSG